MSKQTNAKMIEIFISSGGDDDAMMMFHAMNVFTQFIIERPDMVDKASNHAGALLAKASAEKWQAMVRANEAGNIHVVRLDSVPFNN